MEEFDDNRLDILGLPLFLSDHFLEYFDHLVLEYDHFTAQYPVARSVLHEHAVKGGATESGGGLEPARSDELHDQHFYLLAMHQGT